MTISKFVLLNAHRSGTRLLLGALGNAVSMQCHRRAFELTVILERFVFDRLASPFYKFRTASVKRRIDYVFRQNRLVRDFLTELYTPANNVEVVGIRLLYEQADKHPEILRWAVENNVGIIHLIRKNYLKAIVSYEASLKRGLLHSTTRIRPATTLHVSPTRLERQLATMTHQVETYRILLEHCRYLEVFYESLAADQEVEICRVLEFLNIEPSGPLSIDPVEIIPVQLEDMIENYKEVKLALRQTVFEKFLS